MEDFPVLNISDLQTIWFQMPMPNPQCIGQGGCESDFEVGWTRYILELVLMPSVGIVGVVGNLGSILVLTITNDKTTFKELLMSIDSVLFNFNPFIDYKKIKSVPKLGDITQQQAVKLELSV